MDLTLDLAGERVERYALLDAFARLARADVAGLYDLRVTADGAWFGPVSIVGPRSVVAYFEALSGRPHHRAWSPTNPGVARDRWVGLRIRPGMPTADDYLTNHLDRQRRMLVFDGPRFVGWVGVIWANGTPAPDARKLRHHQGLLAAAVRAEARSRDGWSGDISGATILVRPDGGVDHAVGIEDFTSCTFEALRDATRRLDRGEAERAVIAGRSVGTCVRLVGGSGVRYCWTFVATRPPEAESDPLTARQRRVAELAAEGRSNREIAETLGISIDTARRHLSRSYAAVGAASRLELRSSIRDRS